MQELKCEKKKKFPEGKSAKPQNTLQRLNFVENRVYMQPKHEMSVRVYNQPWQSQIPMRWVHRLGTEKQLLYFGVAWSELVSLAKQKLELNSHK